MDTKHKGSDSWNSPANLVEKDAHYFILFLFFILIILRLGLV